MLVRLARSVVAVFAVLTLAACVDASHDRDRNTVPSCAKKCGTECCTASQVCDTETKSCIACEPKSCDDLGANCGTIDDGCGNKLSCGSCSAPDTCGGGGTPNVCGAGVCVPKTCQELGKNCGALADGCGDLLNCGNCPEGQRCGGGGAANKCGTGECTPESDSQFCSRLGKNCADVTNFDNCDSSRTVNCGTCSGVQTCGGGGKANICGCTGETSEELCAGAGKNCGALTVRDSCGVDRRITCGTCTAPETCGGAGTPNICACAPETDQQFCARQQKNCGSVTANDNCGTSRTANCGTCQAPSTCRPDNTCNCSETNEEFCSRLDKNCGTVTAQDQCSNNRSVNCGSCSFPDECTNNVCGCTETVPQFCARLGKNCGSVTATDKCGISRTYDCGTCTQGQCGGTGVANICGGFVRMPSPVTGSLYSVWAWSSTKAWASGEGGEIVAWNGTSWTSQKPATSQYSLDAIYGIAANNAWAMGYGGKKFFWNGTSWTEKVDWQGISIRSLWGSASRGGYVAVGDNYVTYGCGNHPAVGCVAYTANVPPMIYAISGDELDGVWGATQTVGVAKWDPLDSEWESVTSSTSVPKSISAIWATSSTDVWAAGDISNGSELWRYNGSAWSKTGTLLNDYILDLWASGPNDAWAVGTGGAIMRWDGAQWVYVPPPASVSGQSLYSVFGTGATGDLWITGSNGTILRLTR